MNEVEAHRDRLDGEPDDQHALGAEPIGHEPADRSRPLSEARPAALSTVVAAIAETPWSIALVTMWKIGPECAAQHAKWVSAMAANCGRAQGLPPP